MVVKALIAQNRLKKNKKICETFIKYNPNTNPQLVVILNVHTDVALLNVKNSPKALLP
jgi:hypothetical protein